MNDTTTQYSVSIAYSAMAGISFLEWCSFIVYIVMYEVKKMKQDLTCNNAFTPLNISLLVGGISSTGLYITRALNVRVALDIPWDLLYVTEVFFTASVQFSYMYFSWRRSGKLLRTTMSIREYKPLYYFTWYSPIIIYSPVVPSLWIALTTMYEDVMKDIFRGTFVLAGITACALDGTFTAAFLRALYSTRVDDEKLNPELVVVARYGITSSVLCLSSFALYLVALTKHQPMRIYIEFAGHAILNFVHLTLFFMKVSLLRVKGCVDGSSVNDKEKFLQSETARLEVRAQRASFLHDMQTSSQLQQVTANCTSTRSSAVGAPSTCDNTARRARDSPEGSKTEHVASHGNGNKSTHALRIEKMKTSKVHKSVHSVTTSDRDSNNSRSSVPPLPSLKSLANSTGRDSTSTRKSSKSKLSMHTKKSTGTLKRESETEEPVPRLSTERARRFDPPNSIEESNREKKPQ